MRKWPRFIYKTRGLLMAPPLVFVVLSTWGEVENHWLIFGGGGTVFLLGLLLRIWSQMHLRYRLKAKKTLMQTGPYQVIRNPIYIGNMLLMAGVCVLAELLWFAPIMLLYAAGVYSLAVRHEEARLRQKYPADYEVYCREVPRWLPRPRVFHFRRTRAVGAMTVLSLRAEIHNLLFLLPIAIKEIYR